MGVFKHKHEGLYQAKDPEYERHKIGSMFNELEQLEKRLESKLDEVERATILARIDEIETIIYGPEDPAESTGEEDKE